MRKAVFPYFKFCPFCGRRLSFEERAGLLRPVCRVCGFVQYLNPTVGVAVVLVEDGRLLLGKRARDPFRGRWCIPCGHVEWGEEIREAARREFFEETGLFVRVGDVVAVHSNFHSPLSLTVGVWFEGKREGGRLRAGDDLEEVAFFPLREIKTSMLAFPTDALVIEGLKKIV